MLLLLLLQAATPTIPVTNPTAIIGHFDHGSDQWIPRVFGSAQVLFWKLAAIELAIRMAFAAWEHRGDLGGVLFKLVEFVVKRGFFWTLLLEGPNWLFAITNGFVEVARKAAAWPANKPINTPSKIIADGLNVIQSLMSHALIGGNLFDSLVGFGFLLAALAIAAAFLVVAAHYVKFSIETFLAIRASYIMLALGGSDWTSPYAERVLTLAIAAGLRLMVLTLFIDLGHTFSQNWWTGAAEHAPLSTAGIWIAWRIAMEAIIFAAICWGTPQFVAGMLSGAGALSGQTLIGFLAPIMQSAIAGASVVANTTTGGLASIIGKGATTAASAVGAMAAGTSSNLASSFPFGFGTSGTGAPPQPGPPGGSRGSSPQPPQPKPPKP